MEVTATASMVDDTKSDVSTVIDNRDIQNLPINGRRVDSFVLLTPGVSNDDTTFGLLTFRGVARNLQCNDDAVLRRKRRADPHSMAARMRYRSSRWFPTIFPPSMGAPWAVWVGDLTRFPGGLKPILDAVEAKGMRLGLWIPLAAIGTMTAVYRNHPEWACLDQGGKLKTTGTMGGQKVVMCMASAYRETAAARVIDAVERFRLAYVKLDLTTIFNAYGEAPGCWAKGHYHGNWAESLGMIYEGISYVTGAVYQKHPEVLLDLTFELWGQKHIIDAGLLAAGDLDWMSNVDDSEPDSAGSLQARQLLYQRATAMPVESMLIGNMHAELPTIQETFATAIGSAPLLLGDLRKLSAADCQWYREKIGWFKKLRRSAKISESFFPLGSWLQTSPASWDGFARLDRSGNGLIALFRNQSHTEEATVRLPLLPAGRYRLRSILSGKVLDVFDHSEWASGVPIRFANAKPVEILEVTSVRG